MNSGNPNQDPTVGVVNLLRKLWSQGAAVIELRLLFSKRLAAGLVIQPVERQSKFELLHDIILDEEPEKSHCRPPILDCVLAFLRMMSEWTRKSVNIERTSVPGGSTVTSSAFQCCCLLGGQGRPGTGVCDESFTVSSFHFMVALLL